MAFDHLHPDDRPPGYRSPTEATGLGAGWTDPWAEPSQPQPPSRPVALERAFWCWIAQVALGAVLVFSTLSGPAFDRTIAAAVEAAGLQDADGLADDVRTFYLVVVALMIALQVLFCVKLRQGRGWARIVLTVLQGLSTLSFLLGLLDADGPSDGLVDTTLGWVGAGLGVAALVLVWQRPVTEYVVAVRRIRAGR